MVVDDGSNAPYRSLFARRRSHRDGGTGGRQGGGGAIEVHECQQPGCPPEVLYPRHGFLPAIAALVQVDGGNALTPVNERWHLVRYRLVVKVEAAFRQARPHPFGGVRHEPHRFDSLFDYSLCDVDKRAPGHKHVVPHPGAKRQLAGKPAAHIRHLGANDAHNP